MVRQTLGETSLASPAAASGANVEAVARDAGNRVLHDEVHREARERHINDATMSGYDYHSVVVAAEHGARAAIATLTPSPEQMDGEKQGLAAMVALDEQIEAENPGWMDGDKALMRDAAVGELSENIAGSLAIAKREGVQCFAVMLMLDEAEAVVSALQALNTPTPVEEPAKGAVGEVSQRLLKHMREIARQDGWALGVHGSMTRDLDVIAVPWTDQATDEAAFVEAMRAAVARELQGQAFIGAGDDRRNPGHETKPHGRRCWTIHGISEQLVESEQGAHPYVDLAVMNFREVGAPSLRAAEGLAVKLLAEQLRSECSTYERHARDLEAGRAGPMLKAALRAIDAALASPANAANMVAGDERVTAWDVAQAERHYPPDCWTREAIMDLAGLVAQVRLATLQQPDNP